MAIVKSFPRSQSSFSRKLISSFVPSAQEKPKTAAVYIPGLGTGVPRKVSKMFHSLDLGCDVYSMPRDNSSVLQKVDGVRNEIDDIIKEVVKIQESYHNIVLVGQSMGSSLALLALLEAQKKEIALKVSHCIGTLAVVDWEEILENPPVPIEGNGLNPIIYDMEESNKKYFKSLSEEISNIQAKILLIIGSNDQLQRVSTIENRGQENKNISHIVVPGKGHYDLPLQTQKTHIQNFISS